MSNLLHFREYRAPNPAARAAGWLLSILALIAPPVMGGPGDAAPVAADAPPRIFMSEGEDLLRIRKRIKNGLADPEILGCVEKVRKDAERAMPRGPFSVTHKTMLPPGGDRHDYMSLSPYWWPDPASPTGRPYIRRDGQINPERSKYDLDALEAMCDSVYSLALGYYFTGDEEYARNSALLIRAWYLDPQTRMNPNVKYAQFVPGREDEIRPFGVIETNRMRKVVDAVGLLKGNQSWPANDDKALRQWFREYLAYLRESPQGREEAAQPNNHGTWYAVQTATWAMFIGDDALARTIIETAGNQRIASQIEPDGRQPLELKRTNAFDYSRYNLLALVELSSLGQRLDVDLWHAHTDDGRSIGRALDWLLPYAMGEKNWPYSQITPPKIGEAIALYRRAAVALREPRYEQAVARLRERAGEGDLLDLLYPRLEQAR